MKTRLTGLRIASAAKPRASAARRGVEDWVLDGPAPPVSAGRRVGSTSIEVASRLGLSCLLTAAFAAALALKAGEAVPGPYTLRACEGFFFWSLALVSCVKSHRSGDVSKGGAGVRDGA